MKKIICVCLSIIVIMIGACGCNMNVQESSEETKATVVDYKEEVMQGVDSYLKGKYPSINYEVLGVIPGGGIGGSLYDRVNALVAGGDEETDSFYIKRYKDGEGYRYEDTYFGVYIREVFEKKVQDVANKYFSICKVIVSITAPLDNRLVEGSSLDDYFKLYKNTNLHQGVYIYVEENQELFDKNVDLFLNEMKQKDLPCTYVGLLEIGRTKGLSRKELSNIKNEEFIKIIRATE